jgi:TrmH family RNA methyltransferase
MGERITSLQNARVKLVRALRDKTDRLKHGLFVIDDERDLERALACGLEVSFGFVCPEMAHERPAITLPTALMHEVTREIMLKVSYRENPSPLAVVLHARPVRDAQHLDRVPDAPILALVGLQKPGNIGALMRTADASGIATVFLVDTALDLYNPNIIRSSTGACFLDNVYRLSASDALQFFEQRGYLTVAAHLQGTVALYDVRFPAKTGIILGTEDAGLDDRWRDASKVLMKIPMMGRITDSLNVSVSGAVIMYEVFRQQVSS